MTEHLLLHHFRQCSEVIGKLSEIIGSGWDIFRKHNHLKILSFPMGGAYKYRDILAWFKTMRIKQNLASEFDIQKENWG